MGLRPVDPLDEFVNDMDQIQNGRQLNCSLFFSFPFCINFVTSLFDRVVTAAKIFL